MGEMKRIGIARDEAKQTAVTLGELRVMGLGVFCWCNRCSHSAALTTSELLVEMTPDFPVPEVGPRLICSKCGSKDIATRPDWPSLGPVARH